MSMYHVFRSGVIVSFMVLLAMGFLASCATVSEGERASPDEEVDAALHVEQIRDDFVKLARRSQERIIRKGGVEYVVKLAERSAPRLESEIDLLLAHGRASSVAEFDLYHVHLQYHELFYPDSLDDLVRPQNVVPIYHSLERLHIKRARWAGEFHSIAVDDSGAVFAEIELSSTSDDEIDSRGVAQWAHSRYKEATSTDRPTGSGTGSLGPARTFPTLSGDELARIAEAWADYRRARGLRVHDRRLLNKVRVVEGPGGEEYEAGVRALLSDTSAISRVRDGEISFTFTSRRFEPGYWYPVTVYFERLPSNYVPPTGGDGGEYPRLARAPRVFINADHRWARIGAGNDPLGSLGPQLPHVIVTDMQAISAEISTAEVDPAGALSRSFLVERSVAVAITERYAFLFVIHPHNFLHELPYEL